MTDQQMPDKASRTTRGAPVLPFDWVWEEGETIWPCPHCAPWHADLYENRELRALMVREWHAAECKIWAEVRNL